MRIVVLAGGVGGARFLSGVRAYGASREASREASRGGAVTAVVNVGANVTMHGLRICPDLDTVMYTLGGGGVLAAIAEEATAAMVAAAVELAGR